MIKKILFTSIVLSNLSYGMVIDQIISDKENVFSLGEIASHLAASYYLFDHQAICSFATTSTHNKRLMITTAKKRSERLFTCPSYHPLSQLLHKYGTARCYAIKWPAVPELTLGYHELSNGENITKYNRFSDFIAPIYDTTQIFFNENQEMYFYGYGQHEYNKLDNNDIPQKLYLKGIFRYCINKEIELCTIAETANNDQMGLLAFSGHPSLLQTILRSWGKRIIALKDGFSIPCIEYFFDNIIIPSDDYQEKPAFNANMLPLEKIPDFVKNAIEKRRKEQSC